MMIRDLVYDAEDMLDEMEYFRIQGDVLDAVQHDERPKLRFDRDNASRRIEHIVEKMPLMRQEVYSAINLLGSEWITAPNIAQSRPTTDYLSTEPKLYGRGLMMKTIIYDITQGKHSAEVLTVIPIVGLGGIGKTTLAQHIYQDLEVQKHFAVKVWTCVSLKFNVNKLTEEIEKRIPKVEGESSNCTAGELIGKRLKNKRLLLVLDDIWDCSNEDEWKRLLLPFQKSQVQGNIIIVTTRFPKQAQKMVQKHNQPIYLKGLENKEFEELFLEIIFGDDDQSREDHDFLLDTGFKILDKLKGSPLAAKTVGRLLKTQLDLDHWIRILESKEWEHSNGKNDIMHALKLSFDYLPSHLQHCFPYCALFPQDYKFKKEELINFWIGQEVLHPSPGENKRVEDIGLSHLTELVNYGFLENKEEKDGRTCYIIHDLLHELGRQVSSLECLSIDTQYHVRSLPIPSSIRHLSINIDDTSVNDRLTQKNCVENFNTLHRKLEVEKLQTLVIFGTHHGCFVKVFQDLFREAKALRVIFLSGVSYDVEYLLCNFYCLLHLRYLWIELSRYGLKFPKEISRFYHMMVLDAEDCSVIELPIDMSNLVKLRHFLVSKRCDLNITEVGKLKSLQELRRFMVKQGDQGFQLRQIGHLEELCGSLCIDSLENVEAPEEADEAKLMLKSRLHELKLCWDWCNSLSTNDSALEEHVLERLKPSSNLQDLSIIGHRGATCPSWLGKNLSLSNLESLCLGSVAWQTFPPIGDLWLVDLPHEINILGSIPEKRFGSLRSLELHGLTMVKKWVVHAPCELFPSLKEIIVDDCPQLVELSFEHFDCRHQGKEVNVNLFPRLSELKITNCPQLSSFPPVPWNENPCTINIEGTASLDYLDCENFYEYSLTIEGKKDTTDSTFWNVMDFHNLTGLKALRMDRCESLPLHYLQMLSSLRILEVCRSSIEADSHIKYQFPVESLEITEWNASGKELTQLLTYFPKLSDLKLCVLEKVTGLAVNMKGQRVTETPVPSSSANKVEQKQGARAEDDIIAAPEDAERGLLLLPPQLQELEIENCPELSLLCSSPHEDRNEEDGGTWGRGGGGLQGLTSLRWLVISDCPKFLSAYSSSSFSSSFPFPNSLEDLEIRWALGMGAQLPLLNLTSLTSLEIFNCNDLRSKGLLSLLPQGHLTKLSITGTPNFFVDSEHSQSQVHEQEIPSYSSKLQELQICDVAVFTAANIRHSLLLSSLTKLAIHDDKVDYFTEEQEALLFVNSLETIQFLSCGNLQSLPKWLQRLPKLKRLYIFQCRAIQMIPKDGLPSSLEVLEIEECPEIRSLPKVCLPDSLQILRIINCPAIRSLPEVDDLPSSLRQIDVWLSGSWELRSQCGKLINIIPIVDA